MDKSLPLQGAGGWASQFLTPQITLFTPKQYKAHNQIFCSGSAPDGSLWFGTANEVLLYDGSDFEHIEVGAGKVVFSIAPDTSGIVFVGCMGDFGYVAPTPLPIPPQRGGHNPLLSSSPIGEDRGEGYTLPFGEGPIAIGRGGVGVWKFYSILSLIPDSLKDFNVIWNTHVLKNKVYFNGTKYLFEYERKTNKIKTIFPGKKFFRSHRVNERIWIQEMGAGLYESQQDSLKFIAGSGFFKDMTVMSVIPFSKIEVGSKAYLIITRKDGMFLFSPKGDLRLNNRTVEQLNNRTSEQRRGELSSAEITYTLPFGEVPPIAIGAIGGGGTALLSKASVYCATALAPLSNPLGACLAIGTALDGIFFFNAKGQLLLHLDQSSGLPSNGIWNFTTGIDNKLWAATDNGIALIHLGNRWTITEEGEEFQGSVQSINQYNGKLWLATTHGLYFAETNPGASLHWKPFQQIKGQCMELLNYKNNLFVAGGNGGLQMVKDERVYKISKYTAYTVAAVSNSDNYIVFGGREGIIVTSPSPYGDVPIAIGRGEVKISTPEEVLSVKGYYKNDTLYIWAGMRTKGVAQVIIPPPSLRSNLPDSIRLLRSFLPRNDGVNSEFKISYYDTTNGLPEGEIKVFTLHNRIVFGTDKGLYRLEDPNSKSQEPSPKNQDPNSKTKSKIFFVPDSSLSPIFCNGTRGVFRLAEGDDGEIWISSTGKTYHLIPHNGKYLIDSIAFQGIDIGTIRAIYPTPLLSPQVGGETSVCWLGGDNGVVCYNKKVNWTHNVKYFTLLRSVNIKLNEKKDSLLFGGALLYGAQPAIPVLPYKYNNIKFTYASPFYDTPEATEYSYRLEGQDTGWSGWSKERKKEYSNLPEGGYIFMAKAKNIYGVESEVAAYTFQVLPPWHRTWWAYLTYLVIGLSVIGFAMWLNTRRLRAYAKMLKQKVDDATVEIREQKKVVEEAHKNTMDSIDYARLIQDAMLTSEEYLRQSFNEYFLLFKPRDVVSGDFYWCYCTGDGKILWAVCDCTGHGVPGAMMSMLCSALLDEITVEKKISAPGEILNQIREAIIEKLANKAEGKRQDGMDCALISLETQKPGMLYAGARNPIFIVRKNGTDPCELIVADADDMPVGYSGYGMKPFATKELHLQKGDMVYMFSDGFKDQIGGPKEKKFSSKRLRELLLSVYDLTAQEQKQKLEYTFEEWKGNGEQLDDVCVMGVRV